LSLYDIRYRSRLRFLSDEDFTNRIVRGLLRSLPTLDILRVQDVGLRKRPDTEVLEWAAKEGRILLTHDADTMIEFAKNRLAAGLAMPGIVEIPQTLPIGEAIAESESSQNVVSQMSGEGRLFSCLCESRNKLRSLPRTAKLLCIDNKTAN